MSGLAEMVYTRTNGPYPVGEGRFTGTRGNPQAATLSGFFRIVDVFDRLSWPVSCLHLPTQSRASCENAQKSRRLSPVKLLQCPRNSPQAAHKGSGPAFEQRAPPGSHRGGDAPVAQHSTNFVSCLALRSQRTLYAEDLLAVNKDGGRFRCLRSGFSSAMVVRIQAAPRRSVVPRGCREGR